jgi:hypothetical protein
MSHLVVAWRRKPGMTKHAIAVLLSQETVSEWPELLENVESFLRDLVAKGHPSVRKVEELNLIPVSGFEIDPDGEMRIV